jgi:hypothetical protein
VQLERRVLFLLLPRARSSGDGGWDVRPRGNISRGEAEESEGERETGGHQWGGRVGE